ncbi:MAG: hypothetical protein DRP01_03770 [Archaeoglobales archaeon]|nr:MAG: hypothetical protein DRP01_03770 [Archaeoglobales archaeon]
MQKSFGGYVMKRITLATFSFPKHAGMSRVNLMVEGSSVILDIPKRKMSCRAQVNVLCQPGIFLCPLAQALAYITLSHGDKDSRVEIAAQAAFRHVKNRMFRCDYKGEFRGSPCALGWRD